jgi:quercetin dioxygenase-like cupin family protein
MPVSGPWLAKQLNLWRHPAGHSPGMRNAPERVFLVILRGAAEVEVSTGKTFVIAAGDMALFEDTDGQGHRFGSADGGEVIGLVVSVTEDSPQRR